MQAIASQLRSTAQSLAGAGRRFRRTDGFGVATSIDPCLTEFATGGVSSLRLVLPFPRPSRRPSCPFLLLSSFLPFISRSPAATSCVGVCRPLHPTVPSSTPHDRLLPLLRGPISTISRACTFIALPAGGACPTHLPPLMSPLSSARAVATSCPTSASRTLNSSGTVAAPRAFGAPSSTQRSRSASPRSLNNPHPLPR
jgi:hypothetical protein